VPSLRSDPCGWATRLQRARVRTARGSWPIIVATSATSSAQRAFKARQRWRWATCHLPTNASTRAVDHSEEELPALSALAELHRRQNNLAAARELLDQVWEPAERGPYPLFHADALNVLAQIERDAGNTAAAIRAATEAFTKAWCDGPPFAYHWGLEKARAHLAALGAPEPALPPFDESKYEPMPEIEIDPDEPTQSGNWALPS